MATNILSLSASDALDFFLSASQYCSIELPKYFDFGPVLQHVRKQVGKKTLKECCNGTSPEGLLGVNLDFITNKDGKYAVRPLTLANPYLYYLLSRDLCDEKNWKALEKCFLCFRKPHFSSNALPVIPSEKEFFPHSTTILNWWNTMEQRSLELSLEYRYMFVSDITNCYGSITPQAIEDALAMKDTKHETGGNKKLAANVLAVLKAMQHGKNIGISQGSTLFDFIAEIVLGYADLLLYERLQVKGIEGYEVLRYRDDYRIFCNNHGQLEDISYILQEVLENLGFRMNTQKTKISSSIVTDSVKPDKLAYIYNTPILNKNGCDFDGIQKHLLYILMFSRDYPNSGQIKTMLSNLDKIIENKLKPREVPKTEKLIEIIGLDNLPADGSAPKEDLDFKEVEIKRTFTVNPSLVENVRAMVAVATQIALENVNATHYALLVISRMVNSVKDEAERLDIIEKVYEKLAHQHNSTYTQIWLQHITYSRDKQLGKRRYDLPLCRLAMGEDVCIWNNTWLEPTLLEGFPSETICDAEQLKELSPVISFKKRYLYSEGEEDEETEE